MVEKESRLYMIGNAHIDVVWLWQWQEGLQEVKATFASVLARMKEYEDFIFTGSSACYYAWIEENEPAMFQEIKARVKQGRWVIVGGWWIQPDCNTASGESYVRQGLYGQKYFEEKLGVRAVTGYNVDSFGHNGMLPQILKKCGLENYVFMRPGRHEKAVDGAVFSWQSTDGSAVRAFRVPFEYCTWPEEIEKHIRRCAGEIKNPGSGLMCFYGVGNHGGGPTKKNIESIAALNEKSDLPELIFASPDDYFLELNKSGGELPVVTGELLHHASGCYSAHGEIKMLNRKAENRLQMAEKLSLVAKTIAQGCYARQRLSEGYQAVLFNQFHDVLTGCCLESAFEDAKEQYGFALHTAAKCLNHSIQSISWQIAIEGEEGMKPLVVFNPNAFAVHYEVEVELYEPKENTVLLDEQGKQIPYQLIRSEASAKGRCRLVFIAQLPSLGWKTYRFCIREGARVFADVSGTENSAENKWLSIQFDEETGYITSLKKKNDNTEYFSRAAAVPVVMEDKSDTWSHGIFRFDQQIGTFIGKAERMEHGPVKVVFRVTSEYASSRLIQDFTVYQELDFILVKTRLDWREEQKLLKLRFPMNMNYLRTAWEIPYGIAQREPNGEEYPMQGFLDLEGANPGLDTDINGLSILNDGCFSGSVSGKNAEITLARSPIYAHHEPYEPEAGRQYHYLDQGIRSFTYALYPHDAGYEKAKTVKLAKIMSQKPIPIFETYHQGKLKQTDSFIKNQADNVMISVLKEAEDGSGDFIIRAYETAGKDTRDCFSLPAAAMKFEVSFTPFELKTVRIQKQGGWMQTNLLEEAEE